MTSQKPFLRFTERNEIRVIGKFENVHGERFVIYCMKNGNTPYITGDEYDWKPRVNLLWNNNEFVFAEDERDKIAKILWPTHDEFFAAVKKAQESLGPEPTTEEVEKAAREAYSAHHGLDLDWPPDED